MRALLAGERAILAGAKLAIYCRVEVKNGSGTYVNLEAAAGGQGVDWLDSVEVWTDIDQPVWSATIALKRSSGVLSLAPLIAGSTMNRDNAAAYAPLASPGHDVRVSIAVTTGAAPGASEWRYLFEGPSDAVRWEQDPIVIDCRDVGAKLLDTFIEAERVYGTAPGGTALQAALQQIIADNIPSGTPTLVTPVSPGVNITQYSQPATTNVMDAIRARALDIAWDIRNRWTGAAGAIGTQQLRLVNPNRSTAVADTSFGPSEYLDITEAGLDRTGVRNKIVLTYKDTALGKRVPVVVQDATSIAEFGLQTLPIDEPDDSPINTNAEAVTLANAILADLKTPKLSHQMETLLFWPAELGDVYDFLSNNVHYDSTQRLGVVSIRHRLSGGSGRTIIGCRGAPAGAYADWLRKGRTGLLPGVPEILTVNTPTPIYEGTDFKGWRILGAVDEDTEGLVVGLSQGLSMRSTTPPYVTAVGPTGGTEYWLDVSTQKQFTIEVNQPAGGAGEMVLEPHQLYNPTTAHPRPGKVGKQWFQPLQLQPVTTHVTTRVTATLFSITLTTRPSDASVRWRLDGVGTNNPWNSATSPDGSVTIGRGTLAEPFLDVSQGDRYLEFYAVSAQGVVEPAHTLKLDANDEPSVVVTLSEPDANVLQVDMAFDDDVVNAKAWAARDQSPIPANQSDPDDSFLVHDAPADTTRFRMHAEGDGGPTSTWDVVVRAYDVLGRYAQQELTLLITGDSDLAITVRNLHAVVRPSPASFVNLFWTPSNALAAAPSGRYVARILVNGVEQVPISANLDAAFQTWPYFGADPAPPGVPGAQYTTLVFDFEIHDTTAPGTPIGTYQTKVADWFYGGATDITLPPPSGTPPAPAVAAGAAGTGQATATWAPPNTIDRIGLEWYADGAAFGGGNGALLDSVVLPIGTAGHTVSGAPILQWVRCRTRYENDAGAGAWGAFSNAVQIPTQGTFF